MTNPRSAPTDPGQPAFYQIRVTGHLSEQWTGWFEGFTITLVEEGDTVLSGPVIDQAALYGLLKKVRDLGLQLVSVNRKNPDHPDEAINNRCEFDENRITEQIRSEK